MDKHEQKHNLTYCSNLNTIGTTELRQISCTQTNRAGLTAFIFFYHKRLR